MCPGEKEGLSWGAVFAKVEEQAAETGHRPMTAGGKRHQRLMERSGSGDSSAALAPGDGIGPGLGSVGHALCASARWTGQLARRQPGKEHPATAIEASCGDVSDGLTHPRARNASLSWAGASEGSSSQEGSREARREARSGGQPLQVARNEAGAGRPMPCGSRLVTVGVTVASHACHSITLPASLCERESRPRHANFLLLLNLSLAPAFVA